VSNLTIGILCAYDALKLHRDGRRNECDVLLNFLRPSISDFDGTLFDAKTIADSLNNLLHISISQHALEQLVPEFEKIGWLTSISDDLALEQYQISCPSNLSPQPSDEIVGLLVSKFRRFLDANGAPNSYPAEDTSLFEMIAQFIISPDKADDIGEAYQNVQNEITPEQRKIFLSLFVQHLADEEKYTNIISDLAKIALLLDMVRDYLKPINLVQKANPLIFLDSPLLLDLLGFSGPDSQENITILLDLARTNGASINVFQISITEAVKVLQATQGISDSARTAPLYGTIVRGDLDISDTVNVAKRLKKILSKEYHFKIFRKIPQWRYVGPDEYEILEKDLQHSYRIARSGNQSFTHDAQAVAAVLRFRGDSYRTNDLWESGVFLFTWNRKLKEIARAFCLSNSSDERSGDMLLFDGHSGPVVDIREFVSSISLRFDAGADTDLPLKYLMAACERNLR
jgi:hypothetical protein